MLMQSSTRDEAVYKHAPTRTHPHARTRTRMQIVLRSVSWTGYRTLSLTKFMTGRSWVRGAWDPLVHLSATFCASVVTFKIIILQIPNLLTYFYWTVLL